jgi:tetratricopeptide (TPR) repeat protein
VTWPQSRSWLLAPLLIICTILTVFWQVSGFEFINFDDPDYVSENPFVIAGLTRASIAWAFSNTLTGHWHPLTWLSHMLDCHLFGLNAGAHHVVNLIFHICNSLLLYRLLVTTTGARGAAFFVALVFGVHPLRIESVVWVSERKDVLSVFFGLISLNLYVWFTRTRSATAYTLVCVAFVLSLLSKPTFVTLPAILILVDVFPLQRYRGGALARTGLKNSVVAKFDQVAARISSTGAEDIFETGSSCWPLIREKLPLFFISGIFCGVALVGQFLGGGLQSTSAYPLPDRIASGVVGYTIYLYKLFAPVGLGIFYPFQAYPLGVTCAAGLLLVTLTALAYSQLRFRPYIFVGWLWFVVTLLPMAGFIQIGGQSMADRWTYLPHIGLIIAVVWSVRDLLAAKPQAHIALACGAVVALASVTMVNLPHWRASIPLFLHTLDVSPHNFMAHTNVGDAYLKKNDFDAAEPHLEAAVQLAPHYPEALNNLGVVYAHRERYVEAVRLFSRALFQRPSFTTARYNLGLVQSRLGKTISALNEWVTVMSQHPSYEQARESASSILAFAEQGECATILRSEGAYAKTAIEHLLATLSKWEPSQRDLPLRSALYTLARCL